MKTTSSLQNTQSGFMLLEALIAILVFSFGVLALVALQAKSIQLTGDAKYRTDATLLANQLIGQMWVSGKNATDMRAAYQTGGDAYMAWLANDVKGSNGLPGVAAAGGGSVSTLPTVTVDNTAGAETEGLVTVTLFWRTPDMAKDAFHKHVVISQIARNAS